MDPITAIIVQQTVGHIVGHVFLSIFPARSSSGDELNVEHLTVFLDTLSRSFSHIVEQIIRMSLVEQDLRGLKATLIETADAFKDYARDKHNTNDLTIAKQKSRELFSKSAVLSDAIMQMPFGSLPKGLNGLNTKDLLQSTAEYQLRFLFLDLVRSISALEILVLGAIPGTAIIDKIKERAVDYHNLVGKYANRILIVADSRDRETGGRFRLRENCKSIINYDGISQFVAVLRTISAERGPQLEPLLNDAEITRHNNSIGYTSFHSPEFISR